MLRITILTVNKDFRGSFQFLVLAKSPVPDCTSVQVAIILLGRDNSQDRLGWFILVDAWVVAGVHWLGLALRVPLDLRWWWTSKWATGKVQRSALRGGRSRGGDGGVRRLQEDGQLNGLRVKLVSCSSFLHPAFKLTIVAIIGCLTYAEIVDSGVGLVIDPGNQGLTLGHVKVLLLHFCYQSSLNWMYKFDHLS